MKINELLAVQQIEEGPVLDKIRNWMRPSYKKTGSESEPVKSESPLTQISNKEAKSIFGKVINGQELDSYELQTLKNVYRQL